MTNKLIYAGRKPHKYYKDILMMVDLGMHEQIFEEFARRVPAGSKILDLGCGEGALSQRLVDNGYDVVSVDKNPSYFKCKGASFVQVDFDDNDAIRGFMSQNAEKFDAVLGIEVIEHVENQWEYMRGLKGLCREGGLMFVSTPNIQSWFGRLNFLRFGQFHQFSQSDLEYGHISPLTQWELQVVADGIGLTLVKRVGLGALPPIYITSIATACASLIGLLLRPFMKGQLDGWCVLSVFKK